MLRSCSAHEQGSLLARPVTVRLAGAVPSTIAAMMRGETKASGAADVPFALAFVLGDLCERRDATEPQVVDPQARLGYGGQQGVRGSPASSQVLRLAHARCPSRPQSLVPPMAA